MGMIVRIPGCETWQGSWWAYGRIAERARKTLSNPDDIYALDESDALQALFLDDTPPDRAARLARSLAPAARALANELRESPRGGRDLEEAETLDELERRLVATYGEG